MGDAQRKEFYRIMLADADRLQHTVEQVLKAGVARQHARPVAAPRASRRRRGWREECVGHGAARAITCRPRRDRARRSASAGTPLVVDGDVDELRTAIANLLDNAVKYSAGGRRSPCTSAAPTPDTVWVRVKDQRRRHPPRAAEAHLQPLLPLPDARARKVKGTGLGLYIVRSIAKRHGGRVFAQSEGEGKGATFTLELPRAKAHLP